MATAGGTIGLGSLRIIPAVDGLLAFMWRRATFGAHTSFLGHSNSRLRANFGGACGFRASAELGHHDLGPLLLQAL